MRLLVGVFVLFSVFRSFRLVQVLFVWSSWRLMIVVEVDVIVLGRIDVVGGGLVRLVGLLGRSAERVWQGRFVFWVLKVGLLFYHDDGG
jgi:hypothetical protein